MIKRFFSYITFLIYINKILIKEGFGLIMSEVYYGVELKSISVFYATMIIRKLTTYDKTPYWLKEEVAFALVCLEYPELITNIEDREKAYEKYEEAVNNSL